MSEDILFLGTTNFRNQEKKFGIKIPDRRQHMYVIGKSGTGKSTLLTNMAIADIVAGRGMCFIDPHGESVEEILHYIPEERVDDVIYVDPSDVSFPVAFNPLERVSFESRHLVASGIMSVFKKIWPDAWSARMEYILSNTLLALLEYPNATLLGIMKMFSDKEYRKKIVENLQDPVVRSFWVDEFSKYNQRFETEALAAIQNKVGQFVANPIIRNIIGQVHSSFDMRRAMDEGKILLINLSKGKIGEDNSALLGAMIITKLQLAAMTRVDMAMQDRRDFFLYVDEFQNFATESFATILSEARKYRLSLVLAHQYIDQLNENVRSAIFGNVGTTVVYRVGANDAEFLEKEYFQEFMSADFVNLPNFNVYIKLMIDGISSKPFSAKILPPPQRPVPSALADILEASREKYSLPREKVEEKITSEFYTVGDQATEMVNRKNERSLAEVIRGGTPAPHLRPKAPHKEPDKSKQVPVDDLKDIIRKAMGKKEEASEAVQPEQAPSTQVSEDAQES